MKRLIPIVLAVACCAPAHAADPSKPSKCYAALDTGAEAVVLRQERSEYVSARLTGACVLSPRVGLFARGHLSAVQDGGSIDFGDYESFRAVEAVLGARYAFLGPLRASVLAGTTLSAEGEKDAPIDARLYTLGGTLGVPIGDGYLEAGAAYDERVGGAAALFAASIPLKGAYTTVDLALPIRAGALRERAYQLRIGAQIRVKRLLF